MSIRSSCLGRVSGPVVVRLAAASAVAALCVGSSALAADYEFVAPANTPSPYNVGANWSGGVVPGAGDAAFINGSRIAVTDAALASTVNSLRVGTSSAGELRIPAGSITAGGLVLGDAAASAGFIDITGGSLTSNGGAVLGEASTADNRIRVNRGTLTLNGETFLGANGRGSLIVTTPDSGASTVTGRRVNIANGAGSNGLLSIGNGSTVTLTETTFVGLRGDGTLSQSGGVSNFARLQVGQENESISRGSVLVTGGTMNVGGPIVTGENSRLANLLDVSGGTVTTDESFAGANGIGTINVRGTGTLNNVGQMHVAASNGSVGTLNVTGGNLNMTGSGGWILVGQNGNGTFNFSAGNIDTKIISVGQDPNSVGTATQTGGTLRSQRTFIIGEVSTSLATYTINNGTVDVGITGTEADLDGLGIFVGSFNGTGTLSVDGGSVTSRSGATIGYGEGGPSVGTVNVTAGTFGTVTPGDEGRVRIGVYAGATGRLNVGGTANVSFAGPILNGVARGGVGVGGTGIVAVNGGTLAAASMVNETGSTFSQVGGTSTLGPVSGGGSMTVSGGTATVARLSQSSLSVTGTGTLRIANAATPAASVVSSLMLAGTGVLDLTNNGLVIDYTGAGGPVASIRASLAAGRVVATQTPADARQGVAYAEASALGIADFLGTPVDGSALVLRSRLRGDANFDGIVNFPDLVRLAQNYNVMGTGVWTTGDFTYDGNVTFPDLVALAQNYNGTLNLSALNGVGGADFTSDWSLAMSLVPEPTSLAALAGIVGVAAIRRRGR